MAAGYSGVGNGGAGSGVAGGEGRYMRDTGDCRFDGDFRPAYRFAALLAAGLIRQRTILLPVRWIRWRKTPPLLGGILCAICYAQLTGTTACALRTVAALAIWGGIKTKADDSGAAGSLLLLSGRVTLLDPVRLYHKRSLAVGICGLPACYSGISGFLRQTEIFHGACAGLATCFTYRQALHFCFASGGAFSWHKRVTAMPGESFAVPGHICDGSSSGGNDSAFNRAVFFLKSGYGA